MAWDRLRKLGTGLWRETKALRWILGRGNGCLGLGMACDGGKELGKACGGVAEGKQSRGKVLKVSAARERKRKGKRERRRNREIEEKVNKYWDHQMDGLVHLIRNSDIFKS